MAHADFDPAPSTALAEVVRLRPIRTLVVSRDRAFHRRATTVLGELGTVALAVLSLEQAGGDDVAQLLRDERADVVVLDATGCEAAAGRLLTRLAETDPRVGVVIVCHHCTEVARELRALPKWGWTQDLRAGVELASRDGNPLQPAALRSPRRGSPWRRMAGPLLRR